MAAQKGLLNHLQPLISREETTYCIRKIIFGNRFPSLRRLVESLPICPHPTTIFAGRISITSPQINQTSVSVFVPDNARHAPGQKFRT